MQGSKADRRSAEQPTPPAPNNNRCHSPSIPESRCSPRPEPEVAHIPAAPAERCWLRILLGRTTPMVVQEMRRKLRNVISWICLICGKIEIINRVLIETCPAQAGRDQLKRCEQESKVRERVDAFASPGPACAPQIRMATDNAAFIESVLRGPLRGLCSGQAPARAARAPERFRLNSFCIRRNPGGG